ncbi:MAG TPA: T9SS type A sorting domain-containing protein, partial [Bacteroidia bacterium]|nr:T9SS type A sorting domain-containing protein [Bacteroidia bacterium]
IPYGPHPLGIGEVWYKLSPTNLVIKWVESGYYHFDDDLYDNFQLIISNGSDPIIPGGNNIEFCYTASNGMQWASSDSSGGVNGFDGIPATVGVNKGDNKSYAVISRFSLPGLTYYGPTFVTNGLYWLNGKSLILNTCVTEKNIPPVIVNSNVCDTLTVCRWDSILYSVFFLCAEQGQKTTLSASSPTLSGIITDTSSNSSSMYVIHVKADIGDAPLGYNTINVIATDNSVPPQTITYPIVINVNICDGVNEVINNSGFSLYPNANNGKFTIQFDNELVPHNYEIRVYDMLGKEIYYEPLSDYKTEVDLSSKSKGMYFLKIYREDTMLGVKKIIIQ